MFTSVKLEIATYLFGTVERISDLDGAQLKTTVRVSEDYTAAQDVVRHLAPHFPVEQGAQPFVVVT